MTTDIQNRNLQLIEDSIDLGVMQLDTQGFILSWNLGAKQITGYSSLDVMGKHFSLLHTHESETPDAEQKLITSRKQGTFEEKNWYKYKNGSLFWGHVILVPMFDSQKKIIGFCQTIRDLTEEKIMEEQIKQSEERLRLLIESCSADYGLIILDPDGYVVSWNAGAQKIKGYSEEEILGRHFSIFYTQQGKDKKKPEEELKISKEQGYYKEEGWRVRKNGMIFWASITVVPMYNSRGVHIGFSKITHDLTEQKKLEKIKNEFISVISHELRTPLTAINGALAILSAEIGKNIIEKYKNLLNIANSNCQSLIRLVDDILCMEKIESGKMDLNIRQYDLSKLVIESVANNIPFGVKFGVKIATSTIIPNAMVPIDPDSIVQVLTHLISNAVKFSSRKEEVLVGMLKKESAIRIFVQDKGIGIPKEFHHKIFEKFTQSDTSSARKRSGTGLGLAISKAIIEKHNGLIGFESEINQGSTFYFDIPMIPGNFA